MAEQWLELTRREAVAAQAKAAAAHQLTAHLSHANVPDGLEYWTAGYSTAVINAQSWAKWWAQDARKAQDTYLRAIASRAAMPAAVAA